MAILEILQYPDSRLATPAQRVEKIDAATRKLIEDMTAAHSDVQQILAQDSVRIQQMRLAPAILERHRQPRKNSAAKLFRRLARVDPP